MRRTGMWSHLWGGLAALTLAACGGGASLTGSPTDPAGSGSSTAAAAITLLTSSNELASDADTAAEGVTLTALATDSNNNTVSGVTISFSSDSGALIVGSSVTGADGTASATLHTGGDPTPRAITVTISAGELQDSAVINVVTGSTGGTASNATAIRLLLSSNELASNASDASQGVTLTALVTDANHNTVQGAGVSFVATSGAIVVNSSTTGADGTATAVLHTGGDSSLRTITVGVSSGNLQDTGTVEVVAPSVPSPENFQMGTLSGTTFTAGAIAVGQPALSAGGSTGLRVDIVDTNNGNALLADDVQVTFTSSCIGQGSATVDSPVTTVSGTGSSTYTARGCVGQDTITARAVVNGTSLTATGVVDVAQAALGSIEFVESQRTTIGIRGSGVPETSELKFRVLDSTGGVVQNQTVSFRLNTTVGGIELNQDSTQTDNSGIASVIVRAGTVHTSVRVTATATSSDGSTTISSQSEQLTITTGIPDQNSFSLVTSCFNLEALALDGETAELTLRAADRFNNPVPDGTAIAFTTEGGSVVGNCNTEGGACSVTWTSQDPRPFGYNGCEGQLPTESNADYDARCAMGSPNGASRPGRSTVLATAIGEESFIDANGDGRFDDGENFDGDPDPSFNSDLGEAFLDVDGDGVFDADGSETFLDFNVNQVRDDDNDLFTGLLCTGPTLCDPDASTLHVRDSVTIIMSGSAPIIESDRDISISGGVFDAASGTFTIPAGGVAFVFFVVRDENDQPMPAETSIALSIDDAASIVGADSYSVPCTLDDTAGGNTYGFAVKANDPTDDGSDESGAAQLTVTSPSGLVSILSFSVVSDTP